MLGGLCKGFLSVLHCGDCLLDFQLVDLMFVHQPPASIPPVSYFIAPRCKQLC